MPKFSLGKLSVVSSVGVEDETDLILYYKFVQKGFNALGLFPFVSIFDKEWT